jgi:large subunit ribosomal protein L24
MRFKIRKGDTVEVISGRLEDKGKRGEVINVLQENRRIVVQGVNIRTKHQKQVQTQAEPTRVAVQRDEDGSRRVCKNCQALID